MSTETGKPAPRLTPMAAAVDAIDGYRAYRAGGFDDYVAREAALADPAVLCPVVDDRDWSDSVHVPRTEAEEAAWRQTLDDLDDADGL